jgi:hypothetical protein
MTTGQNSTTWGNVTNVNLGTAIEEAITGSADVPFTSANVTLTLTDVNTTQAARNLRLNCTGTATAGYNLVVPAIEKVYIIKNATDGTITVKNASGTGIAVPTGKTMWVYNDGTNVVDVATHLTTLTLGTPLPVAQGGTGSNTGTFSGANVTALNGSAIASGLVPIAYGGTNNSTYTDGQLLIGNTTGNTLTKSTLTAGNNITITNGHGSILIDAASGSGTVTSVAGTGTVNGLTLTGTVTTSGSLTLGGALTGVNLSTQTTGVLPIANGGTAANTATDARTALATSGKLAFVAEASLETNTGKISYGSGAVPAGLDNGEIYLKYA